MTRRIVTLLALTGMVAGLFSSYATADKDAKKEAKFAATCPVSGGPAKKESSLKHRGKTVYFCCNNCPNAFKKDRKKFATKVNVQWVETKQITQVGCPISGQPIDDSTGIALGKGKVYFCCNNCKGKGQDAGKELAALVFKNFDKGFTLQTKCPVSGKPIKADAVAKHKGKNVYFCCPNCPKAFAADPDKFLAKLPQFAKKKSKK